MRLRFCCASFTLLCSAVVAIAQTPAPTCADLHIVPAVRECTSVSSIPIGSAGLSILAEKNTEDEFAAEDLRKEAAGRAVVGKPAPSIRLERMTNSSVVREVLSRHHIVFDPAMRDE